MEEDQLLWRVIMEAEAGNAWSDIAASAYKAYAASTGNKNFRGDPMPEFSDLPIAIKIAWEVACRHVGECLNSPVGKLPDPQKWVGFIPNSF